MQHAVAHLCVMTGRDPACVDRIRLAQQVAELGEGVASHARDRRAPARILGDEVLHHVAAKGGFEVEHVVRHAELLADAARVVHAVQRAAGTIGEVLPVAEQLHRRTDDVEPLLHQHCGGDG